jgi:hypothetical protein
MYPAREFKLENTKFTNSNKIFSEKCKEQRYKIAKYKNYKKNKKKNKIKLQLNEKQMIQMTNRKLT